MSGLNKIFEEMVRLNLVGLQKLKKYGEDFLLIIAK
tara:strand:+ start:263 stop:370 length:108 start_codon:yes stop_codon:yes gene_type:complete